MKKLACYTIILLMQLHLTAAPANASQDNLQNLISSIFEDFRSPATTFNITLGRVLFSETLQTHASNGNTDLIFRLSEIRQYTNGESDQFKRLFIEYVISHEIGHKIQFAGYRKGVIESSKGEGSVFLECNADILAGLIMTNELNTIEVPRLKNSNPSFNLSTYIEKNNSAMVAVYEKIFEMDQKNISINTHPSHLQRLMAIRDGIEIGMCTLMAFVNGNTSEVVQAKDLYKTIGKAINFDPSRNNPLFWAHDEAVLITNENNSLVRHLVRYDTHFQRVREPGRSHFNFSFRIYNENPINVRFSCRVYSSVRPRTDRVEFVKKVPLDAAAFDEVIPSGSSIQITGSVTNISEVGYTSSLILPGDPESLYFVMDANNPMPDYTSRESNDNNFTVWDENSLGNIDDHIKDMVSKSDQFSNYTKGIAVSRDSTIERVERGIRRMQPAFKAGMEDDQDFVYNARKHEYFYEFYACEAPDSSVVAEHFREINQKIQASFAGILNAGRIDVNGEGGSEEFLDPNGVAKIRTYLEKNYVAGDFDVQVVILGK
jgi:hypothetical protein